MHIWDFKRVDREYKGWCSFMGIVVLKAENVWLTCCALHNWLLEINGFGCE